MKVKVKQLMTLEKIIVQKYGNATLRKISWCLAKNGKKIRPIVEAAREKLKMPAEAKKLDGALLSLAKEYARKDADGNVIYMERPRGDGQRIPVIGDAEGHQKARDELMASEEWAEAVRADRRHLELVDEILGSDEEIDFYTISESVFEENNDDGSGRKAVISTVDQAFLFELGIIVEDE